MVRTWICRKINTTKVFQLPLSTEVFTDKEERRPNRQRGVCRSVLPVQRNLLRFVERAYGVGVPCHLYSAMCDYFIQTRLIELHSLLAKLDDWMTGSDAGHFILLCSV